eukprot:TRINITY_DN24659_c1_g1_i1.p1 TRINITY_DN24659_c1_g1~~TRINITY_DN24659_c1_g1_i1.p1  ORF type:complete len:475 (-),score=40.14 TRINITY_DN24659_c1_g1_i1:80-1423(-)
MINVVISICIVSSVFASAANLSTIVEAGPLRTEHDGEWEAWMALSAPAASMAGTRVEFWMGGSPAFPSGGAVVQRQMVEELREAGYAVRVAIVDTHVLANRAVDEAIEGHLGQVVIVCDCISLLFLRNHMPSLRKSGHVLGVAVVVHFAFSSDDAYAMETILASAVPEVWDAVTLTADRSGLYRIEQEAYAACDRVIAVSENTFSYLVQDYDVPRELIHTTDTFFHKPDKVRPPAGAHGERTGCFRDDTVRFIMVGTVCPRKNQGVLVNALARLGPVYAGRSWFLDIVGSLDSHSEYAETLRRNISAFDIGHRVKLLGPLQQEQVVDLLVRSDIYLSSSLSESYGIAVAEAALVGLPVVAHSGVGNFSDYIKSDAVRWVHPDGGVDEWVDAIQDVIVRSKELISVASTFGQSARHGVKRQAVVTAVGAVISSGKAAMMQHPTRSNEL